MSRSASAIELENAPIGPSASRIASAEPAESAFRRRRVAAITSSIIVVIIRRRSSWVSRAESTCPYCAFSSWRISLSKGMAASSSSRKSAKLQIVDLDVMLDRRRNSALAVAQGGAPVAQNKRSVMLHEAFERLPGQIQSIEFGVRPLERSDYA